MNRICLYLLISAMSLFLMAGCLNSAFYYPNGMQIETPARYNLKFEEIFFESRDGTRLHAWFIPAQGDALGTVIHFHGSFGNISHSLNQIYWLPSERFNLFTFDYRGYGRSEGEPSRQRVYEDSVAAIEYIASKPSLRNADIFIFGQSLGGAVAISAAAFVKNHHPQIRAIVVEGTFSSYRAEAYDVMEAAVREKAGNVPFLSLQLGAFSFFAVTDSYSPEDLIDRITPTPLLLVHCLQDDVVSSHHSQWLYEKANDPKDLWLIDGCRHLQVFTDAYVENGYRQKLLRFFSEHLQQLSRN